MNLFSNKFVLSENFLNKTFDVLNDIYFENSLIKIPVILVDNTEINGCFKFDVDFEHRLLKNPRIEISSTHKRPYAALEQTMIHEMVHYKVFLELTNEDISSAFDACESKNTELFNKLLYLDDFSHTNKWLTYIDAINNKYKLRIK